MGGLLDGSRDEEMQKGGGESEGGGGVELEGSCVISAAENFFLVARSKILSSLGGLFHSNYTREDTGCI